MKKHHFTIGYQTSYAGRPWQSHEIVISAADGDAAVESAKRMSHVVFHGDSDYYVHFRFLRTIWADGDEDQFVTAFILN